MHYWLSNSSIHKHTNDHVMNKPVTYCRLPRWTCFIAPSPIRHRFRLAFMLIILYWKWRYITAPLSLHKRWRTLILENLISLVSPLFTCSVVFPRIHWNKVRKTEIELCTLTSRNNCQHLMKRYNLSCFFRGLSQSIGQNSLKFKQARRKHIRSLLRLHWPRTALSVFELCNDARPSLADDDNTKLSVKQVKHALTGIVDCGTAW